MLKNKGFTLVETLFVLFIICMLSMMTMIYHPISQSDQSLINEVSQFFYEAKLEAMVTKKNVDVFVNDEIKYQHEGKSKTYQLPDSWSFDKHEMSFNAYGNISSAKTLYLRCSDKTYEFVYQIGSGCFYVRE